MNIVDECRTSRGYACSRRSPRTARSPRPAKQLNGLGGEVDVAGVTLVEDQVEDSQHGCDIPGLVERTPETARLARPIRSAIVASGTR
jgi:hypothetical protein